MNTQEICQLLGVTKEGFRSILKRDQLRGRLLEMGYDLISVEKKGRSNIYNIREIVIVPKETWKEYAAMEFPKVKKVEELGIHAKERLINGTVIPKEIMNKTGVTRQTSERWDGLLVEQGLMSNNGYSYYFLNSTKELQQITYGEYLAYWRKYNQNKLDAEDLAAIAETEEEGDMAERISLAMNGICIKVKSYLVNEFTEKYERVVAALGEA